MQSKAGTVRQYLSKLPSERRNMIEAVRRVILANLDPDLEEGMQYGMIGYSVAHRVYPDGYHCDPRQPLPYAALASQKQYVSLHVMSVYSKPGEEQWVRDRWKAAGKKLDMGKGCIRFRKLDDLPLEAIGELFRRVSARDYVACYEAIRTRTKTTAKKTTKKAVEEKR